MYKRERAFSMSSHMIIASTNRQKARMLQLLLKEATKGNDKVQISTLFDKTLTKDETMLQAVMKQLFEAQDESAQLLARKKALIVAQAFSTTAIGEETLLTIPQVSDEKESFQTKSLRSANELFDTQYIFSAHNAPSFLQDTIHFILQSILHCDDPFSRGASLLSSLALVSSKGETIAQTEARMEGFLAKEERGRRTFEFGSIFIKHEYSKTLSELPESTFMRISHRKRAIDRLYALATQQQKNSSRIQEIS